MNVSDTDSDSDSCPVNFMLRMNKYHIKSGLMTITIGWVKVRTQKGEKELWYTYLGRI